MVIQLSLYCMWAGSPGNDSSLDAWTEIPRGEYQLGSKGAKFSDLMLKIVYNIYMHQPINSEQIGWAFSPGNIFLPVSK